MGSGLGCWLMLARTVQRASHSPLRWRTLQDQSPHRPTRPAPDARDARDPPTRREGPGNPRDRRSPRAGSSVLVLPQFACRGVVVLGRDEHIGGTSLLAESRPCPSASYL